MIIRTLVLAVGAVGVLIAANPVGSAKANPPKGPVCLPSHGGTTVNNNFSKSIIINKPVTITNNVNASKNIWINKPVTINNNIEINKNIDLSKNINISKSIDLSKNINISKSITINKGTTNNFDIDITNNNGNNNDNNNNNNNNNTNTNTNTNNSESNSSSSAYATATATAYATAQFQGALQAQQQMFQQQTGGGGGGSYVMVINKGGDVGALAVASASAPEEEVPCTQQWATVVKAIHAECLDRNGGSHPATRMHPETWLDSTDSSEIYRCLEGSSLHVVIGDVVQSDHGMAGIYQGGQQLSCGPGEALRHFKDGLVKCAVAEKVPDCTERTNLRKYGIGDVFFSYQTQVCARVAVVASKEKKYSTAEDAGVQLTGMGLDGGVGYYGQ